MNFGKILTHTARLRPDSTGLVQREQRWTWRELEDNVAAMSAALVSLGLQKGDRVMVQSPNNRYLFESMYAITRAGAVYVPVNMRASMVETIQIAHVCDAKAVIADIVNIDKAVAACNDSEQLKNIILTQKPEDTPDIGDSAYHIYDELIAAHQDSDYTCIDVVEDDICWHHLTSGTTGVPKGALLSHKIMWYAINNRMLDVVPKLNHEHALLCIAPLTHGTGTFTTCCAAKGAKVVMLSSARFDPEECWRLVEKENITVLFTVPTILMELVKHPAVDRYDHSDLQYVIYGGAPITRPDQKLAIGKLGPVLVQYFGSAEMFGIGTVVYPHMHSPEDGDPMAPIGSCGVPRTGTELKILDDDLNEVPCGEVGEICVRGMGAFAGYYKMEEANAQVFRGGWVHSGDLGYQDERGFVYIVGRSKEMYKSGGLQVYPNETEGYLAKHPAVDQVHVVSLPDSKWGEIGVAIVKLKQGQQATEAELLEFMREFLAGYKQPKRIFIWEEIPKAPYGKVPKQLLRDTLYERGDLIMDEDVTPYKELAGVDQ